MTQSKQQRECAPKEALDQKQSGPFPPGSKDKLHRFIKGSLDVWVPDRHVCGHHAAPMDYLWFSYSRDFPRLRNKHPQAALEGATHQSTKFETNSKVKNPNQKNCRQDAGVTDSGRMPELPSSGDCIVWANRAGGKTQLAAVATLLEGLFKRNCQTRILAGSLNQAGRMFGYLRDFVGDKFSHKLDGKMLKESCRFVNGATVQVLPQSSRAVRGQHVHKLRCDEIELFGADVFNAAKFITQSSGRLVGAMEMFSTMHRPYGLMQTLIDDAAQSGIPIFKWCLWEVIERCRGRSCSRCALNEDCQGKARRANGYLRIDDVISQMRRSSRAGFESEMLCLRPNLENAVFEEFDEQVHVKAVRYDRSLPLYRAVDFGFVNPFVCLWIQVDADGVVRVIDEYVRNRATAAANADTIIRRTQCDEHTVAMTFCDPAGAARNGVTGTSEIKVFKDKGIRCQYRKSGILEGVEKIRAALRAGDGTSRLVIDPRCRRLIEALRCYHYPEGGMLSEMPHKDGVHDHPVDALRYFFVNWGRSKAKSSGKY
ncbi:MAG: phage terminase large subunit family protein [Planctomycetota bacterium]